ncbi:MAG: 2-oxoacid:acceptor oxidoreductase family protein [Deltaproteobacteria bacterium]|nr:2-oxoacid:acceptor oxidoreductase family protein [Deltaproteobacteria bacterium]
MTVKTIFAGFGGQGVLLMGYLWALAAMEEGKNVTYLPSYGAEVRGGTANCTVVVSEEEIASPVASSPDFLVVMNNPSLMRFANMVAAGGTILANSSLVHDRVNREDLAEVRLAVNDLAHELGEDRSANVVMLGALAQVSGAVSLDTLKESLARTGLGKKPPVLELNRKALEVGAEAARRVMQGEKP